MPLYNMAASNPATFLRHVGAGEMIGRTTNGPSVGSYETTTNKVNYDTWDFATGEYANFIVGIPVNWNGGTVTATFTWIAASGSGTVIFGLAARAVTDSVALDQAFGTAQTATDTLTTAGDEEISPATSGITIAGSPVAGGQAKFQVSRDGGTLGVDAGLISVSITFSLA
jgi:hypothetical protein